MDPSLKKQLETFKTRAKAAIPVIKNRCAVSTKAKESPKNIARWCAPILDDNTYQLMTGSSQSRFGVLAKIVRHMRSLYFDEDDYALTIDEILDETNLKNIDETVKQWLMTEALENNPRIHVIHHLEIPRYVFRPVYKLKDGKSLIRLLRLNEVRGLGGILLDDVMESLPHCEKILKNRASEIDIITRPSDKKQVLFINDDKSWRIDIDEESQKLWRSIAVDSIEDRKIEYYLKKHGIQSMQYNEPKKAVTENKE